MTDAAAASPSPDPQDPLPESNFFYRRIFSFVFMAALLAFTWYFVAVIGEVARHGSETAIAGLVGIVRLLLYLVALALTYYMLAPSAEQLALIIQTAKSLREGVNIRSDATISAPPLVTPVLRPAAPAAPVLVPGAPEVDAAPRSHS